MRQYYKIFGLVKNNYNPANIISFKLETTRQELSFIKFSLLSSGRVDDSQVEGPGFDSHASQKTFTKS